MSLIKYKNYLIFIIFILVLLLVAYVTRPVPVLLGSYSASLIGLNSSQRKNICRGAKKLDGKFIQSGGKFSFNATVGPRTLEAGFVPSKAIFEQEVVESVGGGICLLSSTLYNAVIRSNLDVTHRVAHTQVIKSVPVGLDATVWYGVNDLQFVNNTSSKVQINATCSYRRLNIAIKGYSSAVMSEITVEKKMVSHNRLQVTVYRHTDNAIEKLSEDIYTIK